MRRNQALPVYVAAGALFSATASRGLLVPLRAHEIGADRFTVGLMFTLFTIAAAVLSLPAGFLSDRFGRRSMVVASAVLGGVSQVAIAAGVSVPLYAAGQVVGGVGAGAAQAALFAAVADVIPHHRVGRAMGWLTLAMQAGFLAGPALAGLLLQAFDLRGDLAVTSSLYVVALATTALFPSERSRPRPDFSVVAPLRELAAGRGFWAVVLGLFAATLVWGTMQAYLPLFAKEVLGLPGAAIGYMLAIQAVSNGASRIPGGQIVDRARSKAPIVVAGVVAYSAVMVILPHTTGFWVPALLLALAVPGLATAFIALTVTLSGIATPERRGVAMGVYGTVLYLGLSAGPAVFGEVLVGQGYAAGFTACAVCATVLALAMLGVRSADRRRVRQAVLLPPAPGA